MMKKTKKKIKNFLCNDLQGGGAYNDNDNEI